MKMALGNSKKGTETTSKPQFEEEQPGAAAAVAEKQEPKKEEPKDEPKETPASAEAKTAATTAVAKASSTSVATNEAVQRAKAFQRELDEMRGASDFSFGNYRMFKANQGEIQESGGEEDSLGKWAKVRLIGWDNHFEVSPGEQGASTKNFVAYSKDGKTIDHVIGEEQKEWAGRSVEDYLKYLREDEDFEKAKVREFVDTACALLGTESSDGPIGEVVQVTLSESSILAFDKYKQGLKDKARCVAMGLPGFSLPEDPFTFYFLREAAQKGDNKWTKLKIVAELPAKI
jgi:hypothetical protein